MLKELSPELRRIMGLPETGPNPALEELESRVLVEQTELEGAIRRAGAREERAACAELVRAAGCLCSVLFWVGAAGDASPHDPRCPEALAAAIEGRGR
jgi:hypothetical protein